MGSPQPSEWVPTSVDTGHIVGGSSRTRPLWQLSADRSGLPVLAGPVEATAIGNLLVQARAKGLVGGDLESVRALVIRAHQPLRYAPFRRRPTGGLPNRTTSRAAELRRREGSMQSRFPARSRAQPVAIYGSRVVGDREARFGATLVAAQQER